MANVQEILVTQKGAEQTSRKIGKVDNSIRGLASSALGYAAAAGAVVSVVKKSIDAYGVQEQAEKRLQVAVGGNIDALKRQASALQQVTTFGDEMILGVQASIAAFVDDEEAIKKATAATLDLAAATGMDLKSAGDLVAKSLGSSTNALSRYGIEVTGAVGSTERLDTLVGNIADKFDGQAAAAADTMAGSIQQAKNAMGDAAEAMGGLLAPAITGIATGFKWAAENVSAFIASMGEGLNIEEKFAQLALDEQIARLALSLKSQLAQMNQLNEGSKLYKITQDAIIETTEKLTAATKRKQDAINEAAEAEWLASQRVSEIRKAEVDYIYSTYIPAYKDIDLAQNDISVSSGEYANFMLQTYAPAMSQALSQTGALLAQTAGDNKRQLIQGMRLSQFAAIASTAAGVAKAYEQGGVLGFITGTAIAATGATQVAAIQGAIKDAQAVKSAATEMDEVVTRPTLIRVGDNAGSLGERVTVSHNDGRQQSGGMTLNFYGNITDREYVRGFLIPEIERATRLNA